MSPILIRPVREQLEHDRVIRLLQGKWRRKYEAAANPGDERNAPLKVKGGTFFPDLILAIPEGARKLQAVVEVETSESLNHLEAMAQWTHFSKSKAHFFLFVPAAGVDVARRLAEQHHVTIGEMWSYYQIGDQVRFLEVFRGKGMPELSMADEEELPASKVEVVAATAASEATAVVSDVAAPAKRGGGKQVAPQAPAAKGATGKDAGAKHKVSKPAAAKQPATKPSAARSASAKPPAKASPASKPKASAKPAPVRAAKGAKPSKAKGQTKPAPRKPAAARGAARPVKAGRVQAAKAASRRPPAKKASSASKRSRSRR